MEQLLFTPIAYLKGVGPKRGEVLEREAGISTFGDLLYYFPFRYIDKSAYQAVADVPHTREAVQLRGQITGYRTITSGRTQRLEAVFEDATGRLDLMWFKGIKWVVPKLQTGGWVSIYGKAKKFGDRFTIAHPELRLLKTPKEDTRGLQAVYHSGEALQKLGFHSKGIAKIVAQLLPQIKGKVTEPIPDWIVRQLQLISLEQALLEIHLPSSPERLNAARRRLKFEELFVLQLELLFRKQTTKKQIKGFPLEKVGAQFTTFYRSHLPFELTHAQKRVIKEIRADMKSGLQMNRLLQGDVGSGKTLVALMVALIAIDNGYQACLMAPTELLAHQHFHTIAQLVEHMDVNMALLTGSTKPSARRQTLEQLLSGEMHLLIGTHALLEDRVQYANLGLAIVDEQHRFGVAQRSRLWKKNALPPHVLVMTATPIPRTLAMTFYGDLDYSVIDELPPGRKSIQTSHRTEAARLQVFQFVEGEIAKGRQVYIVYPLIEESEKMDYHNLMDGYEAIVRRFPLPTYRVSVVHGKMKAEAKEYEMQQFVDGTTQIMVATTVIEVGVNVPNASVMIVESAEKFGLSQLHQLRGRVGRGADQSYCILMTGYRLGADARKRIATMVKTDDGFEIAAADLELRGPGDIMGTQQSGLLQLKLADLARDASLVQLARQKAQALIERDPTLSAPEHRSVLNALKAILKSKPNWSRIA